MREMSVAAGSAFDKQEEERAIGNVLSGAAEAEGYVRPPRRPRPFR